MIGTPCARLTCDKTGTSIDGRGLAFCAAHFAELFTTFTKIEDLRVGDETELGKILAVSTIESTIALYVETSTLARCWTRPYLGSEMIKVRR